jgi:hypothetical protein
LKNEIVAAAEKALQDFTGSPLTQESMTAIIRAEVDSTKAIRNLPLGDRVNIDMAMYDAICDRADGTIDYLALMRNARSADDGRLIFAAHEHALARLESDLGRQPMTHHRGFSTIKKSGMNKWLRELRKLSDPRAQQVIKLIEQGTEMHGQPWEDLYKREMREWEERWAAEADPEYKTRIDAQRVTWEMKRKSARRLDSGRKPIDDSPLFGGDRQGTLF